VSLPAHLQRFTEKIPVLHGQGFVRLVDVLGDDGSIVTAARVTTGKGRAHVLGNNLDALGRRCCTVCGLTAERLDTDDPSLRPEIVSLRAWANIAYERAGGDVCREGDRRLIRFMYRNAHHTPFEMCELVLHIRLPMDVHRQLVRHRTASLNEYSTRYSEAIDAALTTPPDAWRAQSNANRQGSSGMVTEWPEGWETRASTDGRGYEVHIADGLDSRGLRWAPEGLSREAMTPGAYLAAREDDVQTLAREVYEERLAFGVAKEQARKDLPLSNFTEIYWKCDLRNLLHFLGLRMDEHAQLEIREYANVIGDIVKAWCPLSFEAWEDYAFKAVTCSRQEWAAVQRMLRDFAASLAVEGQGINPASFLSPGTPKRELAEFAAKLGLEKP